MFNSKALKTLPKRFMTEECGCPEGDHKDHSFFNKCLRTIGRFYMFNIYYPIESLFHRLHERIGRSMAFARFGYMNYDFDFHCVYELLVFKSKRVQRSLINGHAIQEKEDMDALQEFIDVCKRLSKENYEEQYYDALEVKWGKRPDFDMEPNVDADGEVRTYRMISYDPPNVKTEEDKILYDKEQKGCWESGELDRRKDIDRMAELLKTYGPRWWD